MATTIANRGKRERAKANEIISKPTAFATILCKKCGYHGFLIWNDSNVAYKYYTCPQCRAIRKHLTIEREMYNG